MNQKTLLGLLFILLSNTLISAQEYDDDTIAQSIRSSIIEADQNMAEILIEGDISVYNERFPIDFISVAKLNKSQLRILRNLIYARHGYAFKSDDLKDYFNKFEWYKPQYNNVDNKLNYADKRNIEIVQAFENMNHIQNGVISDKSIIGLWHISLIMPSGFSLVFQFYEDKTFKFRYSQMAWVPIIDSFAGTYDIEGNTILLKIQEMNKFNHSEEVVDAAFLGLQWKESEMIEMESTEELRFPISKLLTVKDIFDDEDRYPESMKDREVIILGGVNFYKYSSDPDNYR